MAKIETYDERQVCGRRSAGSGVLYLENWEDNVLRPRWLEAWPEALESQVKRYVAQRRWFEPEDADALAARLGLISKIQSLNSEDAITWSWFGTLGCADPNERRPAIQWLYDRLGLDTTASLEAKIDQWIRVLHPNATDSPNGPELDARISDPGRALVYVESKWDAPFGTGKGAADRGRDDQIVLRRDSLRKDPALRTDDGSFAVLIVAETQPDLDAYVESSVAQGQQMRPVSIAWLSWSELAECDVHPEAEAFRHYLSWKSEHSGRAGT